jgi:hypothetical protein
MAQTKKKRRRKHRGTPAGTVERSHSRPKGKPKTKEESRQLARERRNARLDQEPTWRSAINRAAIGSLVFGVFYLVALNHSAPQAAILAVVVFLFYIPLGYMTDRAVYNFRRRRRG